MSIRFNKYSKNDFNVEMDEVYDIYKDTKITNTILKEFIKFLVDSEEIKDLNILHLTQVVVDDKLPSWTRVEFRFDSYLNNLGGWGNVRLHASFDKKHKQVLLNKAEEVDPLSRYSQEYYPISKSLENEIFSNFGESQVVLYAYNKKENKFKKSLNYMSIQNVSREEFLDSAYLLLGSDNMLTVRFSTYLSLIKEKVFMNTRDIFSIRVLNNINNPKRIELSNKYHKRFVSSKLYKELLSESKVYRLGLSRVDVTYVDLEKEINGIKYRLMFCRDIIVFHEVGTKNIEVLNIHSTNESKEYYMKKLFTYLRFMDNKYNSEEVYKDIVKIYDFRVK